jgi:hypothetical protein
MSCNLQALQTDPWIIHLRKQKRIGSKNLPIHDLPNLGLEVLGLASEHTEKTSKSS